MAKCILTIEIPCSAFVLRYSWETVVCLETSGFSLLPAVCENLAKNSHIHELKHGIIFIRKHQDFCDTVIFHTVEKLSTPRELVCGFANGM